MYLITGATGNVGGPLARQLHEQGRRLTGRHAAPWEQGYVIWESVQDAFAWLEED